MKESYLNVESDTGIDLENGILLAETQTHGCHHDVGFIGWIK